MRVKTMLAAVAAIAALSAAPAFAETVNSGYVGVSAANFDSDDDDAQSYALEGAVAFPLSGAWGVQLDATAATLDSDADNADSLGGTAHVFHRTAGALIGGFVGVADVEDFTAYGGGVEAQLYRGDWTFGGRVAYVTDDEDFDSDTWAVEAGATYFITPNFAASGAVAYSDTSVDSIGVDDFNTVTVSAGAEYQLATAPISFFGGVSYTDVEEASEVTGVQIGVRWNWNSESLLDRNRTGASLAGLAGLVPNL